MSSTVRRKYTYDPSTDKGGSGEDGVRIYAWDDASQTLLELNTPTVVIDQTTAGGGTIAQQTLETATYVVSGETVTATELNPFRIRALKYALRHFQFQKQIDVAAADTIFLVDNAAVKEPSKATIDLTTGITLDHDWAFLRPIATNAISNWSVTGASAHEATDEGVDTADDDTTYVQCTSGTNNLQLQLESLTPTPGYDTGHFIRIRARRVSGSGQQIDWVLREGATARVSGSIAPSELSTSWATFDFLLDDSLVAGITAYTNLQLQITATAANVRITAVELRISGRISITENKDMQVVYDFLQSKAQDEPQFPFLEFISAPNSFPPSIFESFYDIRIANGVTLSPSDSFINMPNNEMIFEGTGDYAGTVTDFNGTRVKIRVTGVTEGTRCYIEADAGGPETAGTVLLEADADENGEAVANYLYSADQPVIVRARNSGIIGAAIAYDDETTINVDSTDFARQRSTIGDVNYFQSFSTGSVADRYYIGGIVEYGSMIHRISTAAVGTYTLVWEYWNGSSWATLTTTQADDFSSTGNNIVSFDPPSNWAKTKISTPNEPFDREYFYTRVRFTGSFTTRPLGDNVSLKRTVKYLPFVGQNTIGSTGLSAPATWVEDTIAT